MNDKRPTASDNGHEEEHASQISKIGDNPINKKIYNADTAVQGRRGHEHHITCEKIRSRKYNHNETNREEDCSNRPDEARRILLIPWRRFRRESHGATESEKRTAHAGIEEQLIKSHVRLLGTDPGDQLGGLLGGEGVHCAW